MPNLIELLECKSQGALLRAASECGDTSIVKKLLNEDADVNSCDIVVLCIIFGTVSAKIAPRKCYTNASRVNRYNFPTVNSINLLFSTLHTTPFHYGKTYFGALYQFLADVTRSDTPWGSKPPHLQVGAFKLLQIQ